MMLNAGEMLHEARRVTARARAAGIACSVQPIKLGGLNGGEYGMMLRVGYRGRFDAGSFVRATKLHGHEATKRAWRRRILGWIRDGVGREFLEQRNG